MNILSRREQFDRLFPNQPAFRWKQIAEAFFRPGTKGWDDIKTLPKEMRVTLTAQVPWMTVSAVQVQESRNRDTFKAVLQGVDGKPFESVLMANKREQWTICVSSQIGCAMRCTFCATGTMGLKRSLLADEIVDQYRFWKYFLYDQEPILTPNNPIPNPLTPRISNVVFMGMGEPLANYDNVKEAIRTWLSQTDIGPTRITVSSVGVLTQLEHLLTDPDWPNVRIAISLHSANQQKRKEIVPTTVDDFLLKLAAWSHRYAEILGNRRHYVTYEYTLLSGVNDMPELAEELARYIKTTSSSKINVIPYNPVPGKPFERSQQEGIDRFKDILLSHGLNVTQRKTMGDDIAAACGQLATAQGSVS